MPHNIGSAHPQSNPWKLATMSLLVSSTALITGVVVANYVGSEKPHPITLQREAPVQRVAPRPAEADIEACNRYAGAGIGSLLGAGAGTFYGLNQTNQSDPRAAAAYRTCMERRGYSE